MPKLRPEGRLRELAEAATRVFLERGYRRTQMADVAGEMGVAKGTIYLYVESKEALLDLVFRHAGGDPLPEEAPLPLPTPKDGALLSYVADRVGREPFWPTLEDALRRRKPRPIRAELDEILRDFHRQLARNRVAIKLLDRCSADQPELAAVYFGGGRIHLLHQLARYLRRRASAGRLRLVAAPEVVARIVLETLVFWAVHRHWDPAPQEIDDSAAEDAVVAFLSGALLVENEG